MSLFRDEIRAWEHLHESDLAHCNKLAADNTHLLERIKVLEVENDAYKNRNDLEFINMKEELDQAHSALKCALDALEVLIKSAPHSGEGAERALACIKGREAIAQIHACGIDGESKEHPAVARVKELEVDVDRVATDAGDFRRQLDQATAILRRNLASLRTDVNLKGQINQQRHDDYLEACRICGVEP